MRLLGCNCLLVLGVFTNYLNPSTMRVVSGLSSSLRMSLRGCERVWLSNEHIVTDLVIWTLILKASVRKIHITYKFFNHLIANSDQGQFLNVF